MNTVCLEADRACRCDAARATNRPSVGFPSKRPSLSLVILVRPAHTRLVVLIIFHGGLWSLVDGRGSRDVHHLPLDAPLGRRGCDRPLRRRTHGRDRPFSDSTARAGGDAGHAGCQVGDRETGRFSTEDRRPSGHARDLDHEPLCCHLSVLDQRAQSPETGRGDVVESRRGKVRDLRDATSEAGLGGGLSLRG